jgi:hypothetical protein
MEVTNQNRTDEGVHHYVPQFYLRNFSIGRKNQINVYDKTTDKSYKTAPRNTGAEYGFYEVSGYEGKLVSIEKKRVIGKVILQLLSMQFVQIQLLRPSMTISTT